MAIKVDPDWWQSLFDDVYLITDARTVCDHELTCREVDIYTDIAGIRPEDRILDLCGGQGRHAMEFCRRGVMHCTVFDYSKALIDIGRQAARREKFPIQFARGDARNTKLPENTYDQVLILGNSLGYISEPDADLQILKESLRVLKPGGRLLIDASDGEAVRRKLSSNAWHEIGDDIVVCRHRTIDGNRLCAREMVISKKTGLIRDKAYGIRLYSEKEMVDLVSNAHFSNVQSLSDFSQIRCKADVGCMKHRIIVSACKNR